MPKSDNMIKTTSDKDLSKLNTFGMKVKAACYVEYSEAEDLMSIDWAGLPQPVLPVGSGSNLLFEGDFKGTVLHSVYDKIKILEDRNTADDVYVETGSGVVFDELCHWAARKNLWGIENLSGIPGTVGASAVQNVGAYGVEAGDVIEEVICFDIAERKFVSFSAAQCEFAYRDSYFKHNRGKYIVASVIFKLTSLLSPQLDYGHLREAVERNLELTPMLVRDTVRIIRDEKLPDPAKVGSAGSFFKNPVVENCIYESVVVKAIAEKGNDVKVPHFDLDGGMVKIPAAWLIDFCGFKGKTLGGAAVWQSQPLVIVNASGNATPEEIIGLERQIISEVKEKFGIELHPEVDHIA